MHGHGTFIMCNNEKYVGSFVEGKIHGEGCYYTGNG